MMAKSSKIMVLGVPQREKGRKEKKANSINK